MLAMKSGEKQNLENYYVFLGTLNRFTPQPELVKAHNELDKAVDLTYRPQPFANETKRIEYLFELYDKYTAGLFPAGKKKR